MNKPKIAFIGQPEYFRFIYEKDLDEISEVKEFKLTYTMEKKDFEELLNYSAEINFFFRGEYIPDEVLQNLSGIKVNLSSEPFPRQINKKLEYTKDSLNRYLEFRKIRNKAFDYIFHYDHASLDFMYNDGLILSGEFAFPVATNVYKPKKTKNKWDLFFIGRSTVHREIFFGQLKHYYNFLHIAHGVFGPDLINYINSSSINLNVHAENEISWEPRIQMLLATGAFVISERITPNSYLRPNIDYIEVTSQYDMFEAVKYYLHNPEKRQTISKNGFLRVRELLNSRVVFKNFIHDICIGKYNKFSTTNEKNIFFKKLYNKKFLSR